MKCPHCQNTVSSSDASCRRCGAPIKVLRYTRLAPGEQPTREKAPVWIHLVTVLLVLGAAWAVYVRVFPQRPPTFPAPAAGVTSSPDPAPAAAPVPTAAPTPPPAAPSAAPPAAPPVAAAPKKTERTQPTGIPDAPPAPRPRPSSAVRVGGSIPTPTKLRDVRPVYPPLAVQARIQGVVIIEATIDAEGSVGDARVLRSIPMLDEAALEAVRQWQYTPTLVNGVATPVIMTVTVQFTLK